MIGTRESVEVPPGGELGAEGDRLVQADVVVDGLVAADRGGERKSIGCGRAAFHWDG